MIRLTAVFAAEQQPDFMREYGRILDLDIVSIGAESSQVRVFTNKGFELVLLLGNNGKITDIDARKITLSHPEA